MNTANNTPTVTINVFKDNAGDYLVTAAPQIVAGITTFQLNGPVVDAKGGPLPALDSHPGIVLLMSARSLHDGELGLVSDIVARLEYELVETSERPLTNKLATVLMRNIEA